MPKAGSVTSYGRGSRSVSPPAATTAARGARATSRSKASSASASLIEWLTRLAPMPPWSLSSVQAQVSQLAAIQRVPPPGMLRPSAVRAAFAAA